MSRFILMISILSSLALAEEPALDGRWCEQRGDEVGCYAFKGKTVVEEAVNNRHGYSPASKGTWELDEGLMIMHFPGQDDWIVQLVKVSKKVLILKTIDGKETFTFTRK